MKFFKFGLLACLLFNSCLGIVKRETTPIQSNPEALKILNSLKDQHARNLLCPSNFWELMETSTGMGSCFLGEFIANSSEEDICLIFEFLIEFGKENKKQFYKCMINCLGIDGITPLNELIRRMPAEYNSDSKLIIIFSHLLDLISTFDQQKKIFLLQQRDFYGMGKMDKESQLAARGTYPALTANVCGKNYISQAITQIIEPKDPPISATPDSDSGSSLGSPEMTRTHVPTGFNPEIHRWDGQQFLSPDVKF